VIAVVGITSDLEGEEMGVNREGFKGGDRTSLDLPEEEQSLLKAVHATGKPVVVVLVNGSALAVIWANENVNAILEAWYPGEEGGTAVAETLSGKNNPSGRLPITFYTGVDQLPAFEDYSMKGRTYRYFEGTPLYSFGYGLSYSKFTYSHARARRTQIAAGEPLELEADVKNVSKRDGDEVVQVYLNFSGQTGAPKRALRAFKRIHLNAGQSQHVSFKIYPRDLSFVDLAGERVVEAGNYTVSIGGGQPRLGAGVTTTKFTIQSTSRLPE